MWASVDVFFLDQGRGMYDICVTVQGGILNSSGTLLCQVMVSGSMSNQWFQRSIRHRSEGISGSILPKMTLKAVSWVSLVSWLPEIPKCVCSCWELGINRGQSRPWGAVSHVKLSSSGHPQRCSLCQAHWGPLVWQPPKSWPMLSFASWFTNNCHEQVFL